MYEISDQPEDVRDYSDTDAWEGDFGGAIAPDSDTSVDDIDDSPHPEDSPQGDQRVERGTSGPTLEPGTAEYYDPNDGEWKEGFHPQPSDPTNSETPDVPTDGVIVARRCNEPLPSSPTLHARSSEGTRIVTIWNGRTHEAAMIHIGTGQGAIAGEELIDGTLARVSSLSDPEVVAHVFGDVEAIPDAESRGKAAAWNERLADRLRERGIEPVVVSAGDGKDVYFDTERGFINVYDDPTGKRLYSTVPPVNFGI